MTGTQQGEPNSQFATTGGNAPTAVKKPSVYTEPATGDSAAPAGQNAGEAYARFRQARAGLQPGVSDDAQVESTARVGEWVTVAESAHILDHAYLCVWATVGESACVSGRAVVAYKAVVSGNAQVSGDARVAGNAYVYENAHVYEEARVHGDARVSGNVCMYGWATVQDYAHICGNARVSGRAVVGGTARVSGCALVRGDARAFSGYIAGEADLLAPHHVQTWTDTDGAEWTVARSRVHAGFEAWKGDQAVTGGYPDEVRDMIGTVRCDIPAR